MNKKKVLALVTSVGLIGAIGVGATLAYFTDYEEVTNVVTMGNVNILLTEESTDGILKEDGGYQYGGDTEGVDSDLIPVGFRDIVPGDELDKRATVTLAEDSQDAYIRMKVTLDLNDAGEDSFTMTSFQDEMRAAVDEVNDEKDSTDSAVSEAANDGDWTFSGVWTSNTDGTVTGYFYYSDELAFGSVEAIKFMDNFNVPSEWKNDSADQGFSIALQAQAVQSENFTAIDETTGVWDDPDLDVEKYTP